MTDVVAFEGFQDNPYSYMARADLLVSASVREGLSNVIIEALALGCPVVSTDCPGGPREVLRAGECGALVPVGDPQALAAAIEYTMSNKEITATRVSAGRRRSEDFREEVVFREFARFVLNA
jgi:glycosyltransferase involved in cell wall biosynthesis